MSTFQEVLLVDSVWTAAVEEASNAETPDVEGVEAAAGRIDDLLSESVGAAARMRSILLPYEDLVAEAVGEIAASEQMTATQQEWWQQKVQREGGGSQLLTHALDHIEREVPREREDIGAKVRDLRTRGKSEGDISFETACHFAEGVTVGSALSGDVPLAILAAGLAVYYCTHS